MKGAAPQVGICGVQPCCSCTFAGFGIASEGPVHPGPKAVECDVLLAYIGLCLTRLI